MDGPARRGCGGEMLCYQEATYKIIRHRRVGATPTTPHVRQSAPSAFKSQPWLHCRLALFFSHRGRSVTAPRTASVPQAVPTSGIGIWIFPAGAVVCGVLSPPSLSALSPFPFDHHFCRYCTLLPWYQPLSRAHTCVVHTCTYLPVQANRPFSFSSYSEPYLPAEIAKVRAERSASPTSFQ